MERRLDQILNSAPPAGGDTSDVTNRVGVLLNELIDSEAYNQLPTALGKILSETVPVHVMKAAILQFATSVQQRLKGDAFETIASQAVSAMRSHVLNFDDADRLLREALFEHFLGQEQFKEGAQMLSGVNVEVLSDQEKVGVTEQNRAISGGFSLNVPICARHCHSRTCMCAAPRPS